MQGEGTQPEPSFGATELGYHDLIQSLDAIVYELDPHTLRLTFISRWAEDLLGYPPDRWMDDPDLWMHIIHPEDADEMLNAGLAAIAEKRDTEIECRVRTSSGHYVWLRSSVQAIVDERGEVTKVRGLVVDITERKRAEERLRENEAWLSFLAETNTLLAASLDSSLVLERLAAASIPYVGDWCIIDVVDGAGRIQRVAVAHGDHEARDHIELVRRFAPEGGSPAGVAQIIRSGQAALADDLSEGLLQDIAKDERHREILRSLGLRSLMCVPLIARGRTIGAITFATAGSDRRYDKTDLQRAEDLARRAALAIDNARLYEQHAHVARTLQQSLLPPHLPAIQGLEVDARFIPAREGLEVGGDFYDVFPTSEHSWAAVVGDVCGKGVEAATLTALTRYALRTAATQAPKPSEILEIANRTLLQHGSDERFCSVVYARLDPIKEGVRVTMASAGHPLPYLLRADGQLTKVGRLGTILGVFDDVEVHDMVVDLDPGDALVLFTDGVPDARGPQGPFGEQRLEELVLTCVGMITSEIADCVADAVHEYQDGRPFDDIAVVALKVPPEPV